MPKKEKTASLFALALSAALILYFYPQLQHPQALQSFILGLGWKGILLDLLIITVQMLIPVIPFALLAGMNTILFGWAFGFILSLLGSLLGSSLGFALSRVLGQEWAQPKLSKLGKWSRLSDAKNFYLIVLARLIPFLPAAAVNYAAGISPMKFASFLGATLLGKIPMIAWESWIGHDFWKLLHHPWRFTLSLLIGAFLIGSAWYGWLCIDKSENT